MINGRMDDVIFHPLQDDGRILIKDCVQWNHVYVYSWKDVRLRQVSNPRPVPLDHSPGLIPQL